MKNLHIPCILTLAVLALPCLSIRASTLLINPDIDGYIRASGSHFTTGTSILVGRTATADDFLNGLLSFDISSVPNGMQVSSISLTLYSSGIDSTSENEDTTFYLYEVLRDFTTDATWTTYSTGNDWQTPGAYGVDDRGTELLSSATWNPTTSATATPHTFDNSAAFVNAANIALQDDGILNLWLGIDPSLTDRHVGRLRSTRHAGSLPPRLTIEYSVIPEPSTTAVIFAVIALAATMAHRRRTRR